MMPRRWRFRKNSGDFADTKGPPKSLQAGGTLDEGAIYIERPADKEIAKRLRAGEFCHVLAPRQVGKSSLRDRAARRLEAEGVLCAQLDLSGTGGDLDEDVDDVERQQDDWLYSRARQILDDLAPKVPGGALTSLDMDAAWDAHAAMEPHLRFRLFLHDSVLAPAAAAGKSVVIFIDEIDVLLSYRWRDNFFSTIRAIYNERARAPVYRAVTFCLVGLAHPAELMRKPEHTPFNNSHAVELTDFEEDDQGPFVRALRAAGLRDASDLVGEVFNWTRGHPYMTQKLCKALVESHDRDGDPETRVAALAKAIFLTRGREIEAVIQYAERYLLADKLTARSVDMLMEYGRVVDGDAISIADTGLTAAQLHLRFSGIVADVNEEDGRFLVQRNRVFAEAFDMPWLKDHLRDAEIAVRALDFERASADEKPNLMLMDEELEKLVFGLTAPPAEAPAVTEGTPISKKAPSRPDPTLSPAVVKLLTASLEMARQKAKEAEAEAAKRELAASAKAEAERLRAEEAYRRRRWALIAVICFLAIIIVLVVLAGIAIKATRHAQEAERDAQEQRDAANRRSLADKATAASKDGLELDALVWALNSAVFKDHEREGIPTFAADSLAEAVTAARHSYPLESAPQSEYSMFSDDGRRGLTGGGEQAILWDLTTRRTLSKLKVPKALLWPPLLSPAGDSAISLEQSGKVQVWSFARGGGRAEPDIVPRGSSTPLPGADRLNVAVFSSDRSRIASFVPSARQDVGQWTVFNTATGESLFAAQGPALAAAAFYQKGQRFAYIDASWTLRAHSLDGGEAIPHREPSLPGGDAPIDVKRSANQPLLTVTPDDMLLVAARGPHLRTWSADSGADVHSMDAVGPISAVRFYEDKIITITDKDVLQVWTRDGKQTNFLTQAGLAEDVAFDEPKSRMLLLQDGAVRVASIPPRDRGEPLFTGGRRVGGIGFTADGQALTGGKSGVLRVWDLPQGRLVGHHATVSFIGARKRGDVLVTASQDHTVRTWHLDGRAIRSFPEDASQSLPVPTVAAVSPSGEDLVVGYEDGSIRCWDTRTGELYRERLREARWLDVAFKGTTGRYAISSLDISADGSLVLAASADGVVSLLTTTGDLLQRYEPSSQQRSSPLSKPFVEFSPDSRSALIQDPQHVLIWDLQKEGPASLDSAPAISIVSAEFSPDGTAVMTVTGDNRIHTFELRTCPGQPPCETEAARIGLAPSARDAAFSPNGRFIAISVENAGVEIWDLMQTYAPTVVRGAAMSGSGQPTRTMVFSPDSRHLAWRTDAATLLYRIEVDPHWDSLNEVTYISYPSDGANPSQILFTPDGRQLATSYQDKNGAVRLDPTSDSGLVHLACDLLDGQFDLDRWTDTRRPLVADEAVPRATAADWARAKTICTDWAPQLAD